MIVVEFDNYFQEQRYQSQTKLQYPALSIGLLTESGKLRMECIFEHCTIVFALCREVISLKLLMYYYYYIFHSAFVYFYCLFHCFLLFKVYMCVFLFRFTEQVTTRMEHRSDTAIIG